MDDVTPGNPAGIRDLARHWTQQGEAAESASSTLGSAKNNIEGGALRLKGDFAPKIRDAIGDLPGELQKLARGYRGCGRALDTFATRLTEAQQKSRRARDDWDVATRNKRNAEYDLDSLAPGWEAYAQSPASLRTHLAGQPEPVMSAATRRENADRDVDLATTLSRQAAALRGDAESTCVREIKDALEDSGLQNRTWYQKVGDYLAESFTTWDGFVKFCENVALVLGVIALFLTGPLALIVGAILIVAAVVAVADKLMKLARGEIGWGELAFELGMVVLARFGGRALGPAFRRLVNSKAVKGFSNQVHKAGDRLADRLNLGDRARNLAHRGICTVTGHPIDIATGKMFTDVVDLELPGPVPFVFERIWYSTSTYAGPLGHGWHHSFDAALYATADALLYRTPDGRLVDLMPLYPDTQYYDRQERVTVSRDSAGYRIRTRDGLSYRFAPLGPGADLVVHTLQDVVSRAGHRISLSYDERGLLSEIVDTGGRELHFEHDEDGRIVRFSAPHPDQDTERVLVAEYGYDELGNLISTTDALGHRREYDYDKHLMVRESNRNGLSFRFEYDRADEAARCLRTWGDDGLYERRLTYQPGVTVVTNSLGHSTRLEHEGGLVVRSIDPLGAENRTEYEYQQPVREIDALGRVTAHEYDYRGNEIRTTGPDGVTVAVTFDQNDRPVRATDAVGGEWTWQHDESAQLLEARDPLGRASGFAYRNGLLTALTDPAGNVLRIGYDERGLMNTVTTADGRVNRRRYDVLGRSVVATDALGGEHRRHYDLLGRLVRLEKADGNEHRFEYDPEGNLLTALDRLSDVTLTYSGTGRIASRSQAGTTIRFEYDTEETLTAVTNEHGVVYGFSQGPTGLLMSERGFDGLLRIYERDVLGRLVSVRRASGAISRYEYGAGDQVVAVVHSDGTGERFGYRADGELMSAENDRTTVRFERDLLGRVVREFQGEHWVSSEYDALGFRVRVRSSFGLDQRITRDAVGAVTGVSAAGFGGGDDTAFEAGFTRDLLGQELVRNLPGGVQARWQRDVLGRPVRHDVVGAAGTVRDRTYEWDVDDRLSGVVDAVGGPIRYRHDALDQLTAAEAGGRVELRMPDAVGNLFRTADRSDRVYGTAGQLLEATDEDGRSVAYEYDAEGNLVTKRASDGEVWRYRWGVDGHLAEVVRPDGTVVGFGYDALGRRVAKEFRGQRTRWVWDGDVPLHEWVEGELIESASAPAPAWNPDGVVAQREAALSEFLLRGPPQRGTVTEPITWLFEPESFAPLAKLVAGRSESIVTDHLGTPVAMIDENGTTTWSGELSTWGELQSDTGHDWSCPFRRPGQYEDAETGLYYNRFRYYLPEAGQYVSADPLRLSGGLRCYAYVPDPLNSDDVFGLSKGKHGGEWLNPANLQETAVKIHEPLGPFAAVRRVTTVTQGVDADNIVRHTVTNSVGYLTGAQQAVARELFGDEVRMPQMDLPRRRGPRDLGGLKDHHGEPVGIRFTTGQRNRVQASYGAAKHGGKACKSCAGAQAANGIANVTGVQ